MKNIWIVAWMLLGSRSGVAQVAGGAGAYGETGINPVQNELLKRMQTPAEQKDDGTSTFIEASVLMNVKADEYAAVFGISQQGKTPDEANARVQTALNGFQNDLKTLGVVEAEMFVDFVAQNRIYAFRIEEEKKIASEELAGFEVKKNLSIRFKNPLLVDQMVAAAARSQIFDLIKVDYIVTNAATIQAALQNQTMMLLKAKAARYQSVLGIKLPQISQIVADKPSIYFPLEQYNSYIASESENLSTTYVDGSRLGVLKARKSRTTFFAPLKGSDFDIVINPVILEPVVQFTTYLKVKYNSKTRKK